MIMAINKEIPLYGFDILQSKAKKDVKNTHAILYSYEPDGQTYFEPVDHLRINSRTERVIQWQGRSLGRVAIGFFSPKYQIGEADISANNAATREAAEKAVDEEVTVQTNK